MAAPKLEISIFGEKLVSRTLTRFAENADDMRPAFDKIHKFFLKTIETTQFNSQGAFSGGWAPLAPSTLAGKRRAGLDPRILHATLRLRKSLTNSTSSDHVYKVTADGMELGSKVPYGRYHQSGTVNMPQRRPVQFTAEHKREMVKMLQQHLMDSR